MDARTWTHLAALKKKVDGWMSGEQLDRDAIETLRWDLILLEYLIEDRKGWELSPGPKIGNPICSEPLCKADSMTPGGLLNHASAGFDPVWYCPKHLKQLEHTHHVPGSKHPTEPLRQRAEEMSKAWTRFVRVLAFGEPMLANIRPSAALAAAVEIEEELKL